MHAILWIIDKIEQSMLFNYFDRLDNFDADCIIIIHNMDDQACNHTWDIKVYERRHRRTSARNRNSYKKGLAIKKYLSLLPPKIYGTFVYVYHAFSLSTTSFKWVKTNSLDKVYQNLR